jgi:hypothetical protein
VVDPKEELHDRRGDAQHRRDAQEYGRSPGVPSSPRDWTERARSPTGGAHRRPRASRTWHGFDDGSAASAEASGRRKGERRSVLTRHGHEDPRRLPLHGLRVDGHLRPMRSAPDVPGQRLRKEVRRPAAAGRMDPGSSGGTSGDGHSRDRDRVFARLPLEGATELPRTPHSPARAADRGTASSAQVNDVRWAPVGRLIERVGSLRDVRGSLSNGDGRDPRFACACCDCQRGCRGCACGSAGVPCSASGDTLGST